MGRNKGIIMSDKRKFECVGCINPCLLIVSENDLEPDACPYNELTFSAWMELESEPLHETVEAVVVCENSACQYWKDDHYCLIDKTAHCPIYEGYELLNGNCSSFIPTKPEESK
jgi:hypothetical protein